MGEKYKQITFVLALACISIVYGCVSQQTVGVEPGSDSDQRLAQAFAHRERNVDVQGSGVVTQLLPDDNEGSRHQRFILRLASGQTLLVAHNIDVAKRIDSLKEGDQVAFRGEYEWNPMGGVIHFTHHDPQGRHASGWLKHNGQTYQ